MSEKLDRLLQRQQYERIKSSVSALVLYAQYQFSYCQVVMVIDESKCTDISGNIIKAWKEKGIAYMRNQGYEDVRALTIIVSDNCDDYRPIASSEPDCWLFEEETGRLLVFENSSDDFIILKRQIENITYEERLLSVESDDSIGTSLSSSYSNNDTKVIYNTTVISRRRMTEYFGQFEVTPVNILMVALNLIFFIFLSSKGSTLDANYMINRGAMYYDAVVQDHEYYRFLFCMFMHFGFDHLFGNMVVLWFLGPRVEKELGCLKYFALYMIGGLVASIGSFLYSAVWNHNIVSAGASGAIFAVIGALLWLVIKNKGHLENMTTTKVIILIGYAIYSGFRSEQIDMAAHLFGIIAGFGLAVLLYRDQNYY